MAVAFRVVELTDVADCLVVGAADLDTQVSSMIFSNAVRPLTLILATRVTFCRSCF